MNKLELYEKFRFLISEILHAALMCSMCKRIGTLRATSGETLNTTTLRRSSMGKKIRRAASKLGKLWTLLAITIATPDELCYIHQQIVVLEQSVRGRIQALNKVVGGGNDD